VSISPSIFDMTSAFCFCSASSLAHMASMSALALAALAMLAS
jgi:hypothetical protein